MRVRVRVQRVEEPGELERGAGGPAAVQVAAGGSMRERQREGRGAHMTVRASAR